MIHRTFELQYPGGETIRGDFRRPDGPPPPAVVVVAHGFKGFKDWGFFPHLATELADSGLSVVTFNFSLNGIGPDLETFGRLESFARNTISRELDELLWVLARADDGSLLPEKPRRVGLMGHSRGGGTAVLAARDADRVDSLVTWAAVATFDRWDDTTKEAWRREGRIHVLNARTGQELPLDVTLLDDVERNAGRLDVEGAAGQVAVPWLIVHGEDDESVPAEEGRRLNERARDGRLLLVEGAGHTFEVGHPFQGPSAALEEVLRATAEHFRRTLLDG